MHQVLRQRGDHPGLVCIFSVMEPCSSYEPWHDKKTGKTYLRPDGGKCLHYYFYFIDEELGLCYVRVPTWCPFRLQIYLNGHHRLSRRMSRKGIRHWGLVPELGGRTLRVVTLEDGETILNAFPDRNFKLPLESSEAEK